MDLTVDQIAKPVAKIDNWIILDNFPYGQVLAGKISGHPHQEKFQSERQITSTIIKMDEVQGYCETLNTLYTLGVKQDEDGGDTVQAV